ncbi:sn-1-specific diacylglycerol lipase ABHD11 isoform X2 [Pan paniscus]|uniref:sn-1-specific diacylglycerol lipase ABHD11 isoform X2 n=1 Tax=Pan paniscus TaxID=9597 RepID=UPI00155F57F1|nr:protein ABHD11 isoform X2 [Pan paniscus]
MRAGQQLASMLRWTRAWRLPREGLGPHGPSFARVPVAPSSSSGGRGGAEPRPLPLSYRLLDGEAALPAVVFLHGLFGSKTNFNSIAKILAQQTGRRVLTVDARNHGDSPHSPDMSYEIMSQDLQDLLPQLGLVPCVVVGHSMGGKTAMLLALQRVIHPRCPGWYCRPGPVKGRVAPPDRTRNPPPTAAPPQDMAVRQHLLTNLVEVDGRFVWRVNLDALTQHLDKILAFPQRQESYLGPTLFLLGGNSQFVHPSHHPEIMRLFPRAQMQTVPNAGHWIHADRPQDFIAAIRGFLV